MKSTQKITKAMQMVVVSKMRRAQNVWHKVALMPKNAPCYRPFSAS
ncbi:MAG: F0F1 ATP synthase subunit gamma [Moraxellaceae bacterium]|nr:F0F1 ATP synthase subunit gamma [Moraxellaceae bacterium]